MLIMTIILKMFKLSAVDNSHASDGFILKPWIFMTLINKKADGNLLQLQVRSLLNIA